MSPFKLARTNKTDDWLTPPELVRSLGAFDLDPCASHYQSQPLAAHEYKLPEQNGLLLPWEGRVWCNPPFYDITKWAKRFVLHGNGVLICPARVDTLWFKEFWTYANGLFFFLGRTEYFSTRLGKRARPSIEGQALIACGEYNLQAIRRCGYAGTMVISREIISLTRNQSRAILSSCQP